MYQRFCGYYFAYNKLHHGLKTLKSDISLDLVVQIAYKNISDF